MRTRYKSYKDEQLKLLDDADGNLLSRKEIYLSRPGMSYPFVNTLAFGGIEPPTIEPTPFEPLLVSTETDYFGTQHWKGLSLDRIETTDGYIKNDTLSAYYRDFQGNICAVIHGGKLIQATNYYPYGMPIAGGTNPDEQRHKYSGKELLTHYGLNCYDFGPRFYDPALLQFHTPDPLREENPWNHSSLYCSANPIRFTDPTGLCEMQDLVAFLYYSLVAIFPAERDEALQHDLDAAEKNNVPRIIVDNKDDFINAMESLTKMGITVDAVVFNSHGKSGSFSIGSEKIDITQIHNDLADVLHGLDIIISACNVGSEPIGDVFLENFMEDTDANAIYAPMFKVPTKYDYDGQIIFDNIPYGHYFRKISNNMSKSTVRCFTMDKSRGIRYINEMNIYEKSLKTFKLYQKK